MTFDESWVFLMNHDQHLMGLEPGTLALSKERACHLYHYASIVSKWNYNIIKKTNYLNLKQQRNARAGVIVFVWNTQAYTHRQLSSLKAYSDSFGSSLKPCKIKTWKIRIINKVWGYQSIRNCLLSMMALLPQSNYAWNKNP